jgi:hypothetical protein
VVELCVLTSVASLSGHQVSFWMLHFRNIARFRNIKLFIMMMMKLLIKLFMM